MSVKPGKLLSGEDLLQSHICNDRSLPKIGEKQFEPTNSWLEKKQIQTALEDNKQLLEEERVEKIGALAQAEWFNNKKLAEVTRKVGKFFQTMGFEKDGKLFIHPEEALYLMETNCLQLNYDGVPLSIQQAYSLLLSSPGCSLKEYRTYSQLSKQGYRLLRHTETGIPTCYERRIRLDQHVPQKRVFPETNEVTLEPISGDEAGSSGTNEKENSRPVQSSIVERTEITDGPVKSEKDSAEVSEPMKDFAKSIADMGKSLVKNEKDGGSEGLVLENLRKKILDMLEDHFQGQISPEAMDAVSLSASKAIMVHVEDNDSEKTCATPSESVDRSLSSPSISVSNQDSSARNGGKPPDEEDSAMSESVRESEVGVAEVAEKMGDRDTTNVSASPVEPETGSAEDGSKEPSESQLPESIPKKATQSDQDSSARSEGKPSVEQDSAMSVCAESARESEGKPSDEQDSAMSVCAESARESEGKPSDEQDSAMSVCAESARESEGKPSDEQDSAMSVCAESARESEGKPSDEQDSAMSVCAESARECEAGVAEMAEKKEDRDKTDVSASPVEAKEDGSSKVPSEIQLSELLQKGDTQSKESGERISNGNEEINDREIDSEEVEIDEYPVEGSCSLNTSGSDSSEEESHSDLKCQDMGSQTKRQQDMQVDDDVMEIEDPNTWKNVKVEKSSDKDNVSQKRPFPDSNGWRSFKESQSNISPGEKTERDDDDVGIVAVRNAKDIEVELIDISDDSCVKSVQKPEKEQPKEEIEIVDLDESDNSSSSSSEKSDIKQENLEQPQFTSFKRENKQKEPPSKRPKLQSAFERARDQRRKFIMDSFPNMINQVVCKVDVPQRHLLPPNVNPVRSTYFINRRAPYNEPRHSFNNPRRPFNIPRFNSYHNNHPRPYHPPVRQPYKSPMNALPWRPPAQINPAAMQAFQMITSIVLPMFGINNVGPTFMGQPQWNQAPPQWQQPQRNWQNQQQWRPPQHWNNRFNRPWQRNSDREQHDVLDRPKRPALLITPGLSPAGLVWQEERSSHMPRRPKRPFVVEESARDFLVDIEEEARWKKIKRMEEEDSDSESEVTITPVNRTPKTSNLQSLLRLENCKSSCDIMASIDVIKRADPRSLNASPQNRILKISYDLFYPNIPFKKSSPPTPNFRLCVMSVEDRMPSPGEISVLLDSIHDGVPLIFAVVNPDVISYYQYSSVDLPKFTFSS